MSWKGIKKAVQRLPHQVMRTTGQTEGTYDEEFELLNQRFEQLDDSTLKLHDNAVKLKRAIECLLEHQSSFASILCDIYSPISGRSSSPDPSVSPSSTKSCSPVASLKRNLTPPESMEAAQAYLRNIENLGPSFAQELSGIERRIILPATDLMDIYKQIKKTITKRNHKLIDYDRHKLDVTKSRAACKDPKDERKLIGLEQQLQQATHDYTTLNNHIKQQLPTLLNMRIQFIDPCFQSLYLTQFKLYSMLVNAFKPLMVNLHEPVIPAFKHKYAMAEKLVSQLTVLDAKFGGALPPPKYESLSPQSSHSLQAPEKSKLTSPVAMPVPVVMPVPTPVAPAATTSSNPLKVAVALYSFSSQQQGDLAFEEGDRIDVLEATESTNDWWKGRIGDRVGYFPANYTQIV